jgi:hypothetical protein
MGPGSLVDVATDWCHEPVLKLDAGPLSGTRDCCCEHVSAPLSPCGPSGLPVAVNLGGAMEAIVSRLAGIDIGKAVLKATVTE